LKRGTKRRAGLDAPSNYFGGYKVFVEGLPDDEASTWLRYGDDNEDVLPVKGD
jgi:hypothetical protein